MKAEYNSKAFEAIFSPKSVAVVGASNIPGKWGFIVPMNIFTGGYRGKVYLVNPNEKRVLGCDAYPSLSAIGKSVDLAMITVPGPLVPRVIEECGALGIPSAVVISAGFSEAGEEGKQRERELVQRARELGVLFVGPNCMGVASPVSSLYAIGATVHPPRGKYAFLSQSGNLGTQLLGWGEYEGVGFSRFVSSGNEAMAGCEGFLEYFGADPETEVILLYVESIRNGERFFEVAREVSRKKPILALKEGDTEAGARAARSHSGAIAGSRAAYDSMCRQAGIIQAQTTEELIDLSRAFGFLPVPNGDRVGIMTLGGGWGVVTTDQCAREGLQMPPLKEETLKAIDPLLPSFWSRGNPVDLVGITKRSTHFAIAETLARAEEFDSLIILGIMLGLSGSVKNAIQFFMGPWLNVQKRFGLGTYKLSSDILSGIRRSLKKAKKREEKRRKQNNDTDGSMARSRTGGFDLKEVRQWRDEIFAKRIINLIKKQKKPIITVAFAPETAIDLFKKYNLVATAIPEKAVRSLSRLTDYGRWLRKEADRETRPVIPGTPLIPGTPYLIRRELSKVSPEFPELRPSQDPGALFHSFGPYPTEHDAKRLLQLYGLPVTRQALAHDVERAAEIAEKINYPIAMKVMSPDIPHKTEARVIKLNVRNEAELRDAYPELMANALAWKPDATIEGMLVEQMVTGGVEVFVGVNRDPQFGHVMMMGLGGIHVEVMRDVSMRVLPIHPDDCVEMIREIKGSVLLSGYRGSKPADREALVDTLWRLSNLVMDLKDRIAEIDLNPVMALPEGQGCLIADALLVPRKE